MNNAEKYPNTQDALEAWRMYGDCGGNKPFDLWLSLSAEYPAPTLLEAAKKLVEAFIDARTMDDILEDIDNLAKVVNREKAKPLRNCDRYRTGEKAQEAFNSICRTHNVCNECQVRAIRKCCGDENTQCQFLWLYAEAEKEEQKNVDA